MRFNVEKITLKTTPNDLLEVEFTGGRLLELRPPVKMNSFNEDNPPKDPLPEFIILEDRKRDEVRIGTNISEVDGVPFIGDFAALASEIECIVRLVNSKFGGQIPSLGDIEFDGYISLNAIIRPPTITINQNDYNPTGLGSSNTMYFSSNNNNRQISGLQAPGATISQLLLVVNDGLRNIKLLNNNVGSLAANRFLFNGDEIIQPNEAISLLYDHGVTRWRMTGKNT